MVVRGGSSVPLGSDGARGPGGDDGPVSAPSGGVVATMAGARSDHEPSALLRLVTDALPVLVAYVDADQRYRLTNGTYREWLGLSTRETVGHGIREVLGEDAYAAILPYVRRALAGERVTYESSVTYRNGGRRDIRASYVPDISPAGEVRGFVSLVEDVSDQAEVVARAARLQAVSAALSGALGPVEVAEVVVEEIRALLGANLGVVAALSDDGRDFQTLRVVGYPPEAVVGMATVPVDAPSMFGEVVRRREPIFIESGAARAAEYPHFGQIPVAGGNGAAASLPLLYEGRPIGAIGFGFPNDRPFRPEERDLLRTIADLCAQALERARLHAAEARARAAADTERAQLNRLLQQAPNIVAMVAGPEHVVTLANPPFLRLIGQPEPAVVGRRLRDVLPELEVQGYGRRLDEIVASAQTYLVREQPIRWRQGGNDGPETEAYFDLTFQPICRADGSVEGVFMTGIDVTDRVAARRQIEAAVRLRDEFLATAAHDLKNPLTVIKGRAQLAGLHADRIGTGASDRIAEAMATIQGVVEAMGAQIDELLDVSLLRVGQALTLELGPVDLVALAADEVARWRPQAPRHAIGCDGDPNGVLATGDAARLRRVLGNLIGNAVKYSPDGGAIRVSVAREPSAEAPGPDWAVIRVQDQGIGIPAADLPRVFERFHRATNAAGQAKGTGLGLAGVQQIVRLHGGSVKAESIEGEGSTFVVRLPLAPHDDVPSAPDAVGAG